MGLAKLGLMSGVLLLVLGAQAMPRTDVACRIVNDESRASDRLEIFVAPWNQGLLSDRSVSSSVIGLDCVEDKLETHSDIECKGTAVTAGGAQKVIRIVITMSGPGGKGILSDSTRSDALVLACKRERK